VHDLILNFEPPQINTLRCSSELNWVNRQGAKSAKGVFIALRAGYLLRLFTMNNFSGSKPE
jgi:hypothetical protein